MSTLATSPAKSTGRPVARRRPQRRLARASIALLLIFLAFASVAPFVFVFYRSLVAADGATITLDNWLRVFARTNILTGLLNSAIVSGGSALVTTAIGSAAGFAFARLPFKGSKALLTVVVLTMALPLISAIVPLYMNIASVGLIGSYPVTILIYTAFNLAFAVIFFTNYFNAIPHTYVEASLLDGAGYIRTFLQIMLPMAVPALVTILVFDFLIVWNDLLVALLFLPGTGQQTVSMVLASLNSGREFDPGALMAGVFVTTIPNVVIFLVFQRSLLLGFSVGVEK